HWLAAGYLWQWRVTLPVSGALQLAAILIFVHAARQHKLPEAGSAIGRTRPGIEPWMQAVLVSNAALVVALGINFVVGIRLAIQGAAPAIPHQFDQSFLVLLGWGFLAPLVWGFSARWLPTFLGVAPVRGRLLQIAVALDLAGMAAGMAHHTKVMTPMLAGAAILAAVSMRVFDAAQRPAKSIGLHRSFPAFLRIA